MNGINDFEIIEPPPKKLSRRDLIKGVIAGGVAVSSASYLFRAPTLLGQSTTGTGERLLTISVNGQLRRADVMKQETLAWTLRHKLGSPARSWAAIVPNVAPAPCSLMAFLTMLVRCSRTRCAIAKS